VSFTVNSNLQVTVLARFGDVIRQRQHEMMTSSEEQRLDLLVTTAASSSKTT